MSNRTLISVCYDGKVISTPFPRNQQYRGPAIRAQADQHREKVRAHLLASGTARLLMREAA